MPRGGQRLRTEEGKINQIGSRVQSRRLELKLKQDEVCAKLAAQTRGFWNPAWQDISRIENGARIVTDLEVLALAEALDCQASWLLQGLDA